MTSLKRNLGLFETTLMGVGIILGAGIYVLIGAAAGIAGNAVWMSFGLASIVAIFTGMSYAEFTSGRTNDSAEYDYVKRSLSEKLGFMTGWLIVLMGIISSAAVALGFAGYFKALFPAWLISKVFIAICLIAIFSFISYYGIKEAAWTNIIFTLLETVGLLAIIYFGIGSFGKVNYFEMANGFEGIFSAASLIFFAYIGFESIAKLSEETKNPSKTIPKAILLSILISTVIYMLVAISAVSVLDWKILATSSSPLADVAAAAFGSSAFLALSIIALFSTGNTVLIILIGSSRQLYGISKYYKKLTKFAEVSKLRQTPHISILIIGLLAMLFTLINNIETIANLTNFVVFLTFILVNLSLIYKRKKEKSISKGFRVPINYNNIPIPAVLGILTSLFLMAQLDTQVILGGTGLSALGLVIHNFVKE